MAQPACARPPFCLLSWAGPGLKPPSDGKGLRAPVLSSEDKFSALLTDFQRRVAICEARIGVPADGASAMLLKHSSASRNSGIGLRKQVATFMNEVHTGKAQLMLREGPLGTSSPIRVVDITLLRLMAGGKILVEVARQLAGEAKIDTNRLPGGRRDIQESVVEAAHRIKDEVFNNIEDGDGKPSGPVAVPVIFNFRTTEIFQEDKDSLAVPGLVSVYRTEIISGELSTDDPAVLAKVGLSSSNGEIKTSPKDPRSIFLRWLPEAEAQTRGIKIRDPNPVRTIKLMLTPLAIDRPSCGPLSQQIVELDRCADALSAGNKQLAPLRNAVQALEVWLQAKPVDPTSVLEQARAKLHYVVAHEEHLKGFCDTLEDITRMESSINPPFLQEVPLSSAKLRRLEAASHVATGAAVSLHQKISQLVEDYHATMVAVNAQLLDWDAALDRRGRR